MIDLQVINNVAVVTLSRAPVNAIHNDWIDAFHSILEKVLSTPNVGALHIRSDQKVFCAGADLAQISHHFSRHDGADRMVEDIARFHKLFERIESLPIVSLAEIGGAALGGGLELALACDLRIAAFEAKLGLPEAQLGLIPGAGGTQRLTWLCGKGVSSRLILGGEVIDGKTAGDLGIVQWAVPRDRLEFCAKEITSRIAQLSPAALALSKSCIAAAADTERNGFAEELEATRTMFNEPDTRQRISQFLNKSSTQTNTTKDK